MFGKLIWATAKLATGVTLAPITLGASIPLGTAEALKTLTEHSRHKTQKGAKKAKK